VATWITPKKRAASHKWRRARSRAELDLPEIAAADAATDAGVTAEAGLAQTKGAVTAEVVVSRPATDEATARETAAVEASSSPAGQGDPREVTRDVVKEIPASTAASELPEMVTQAASSPGPASGTTTNVPAPETETSAAVGFLLFGATSDPEKASQGAHVARTMESKRGEASPPPRAAAQGALGGKNLTASAGSSARSQSSASQL
jgi:hypothetical protein